MELKDDTPQARIETIDAIERFAGECADALDAVDAVALDPASAGVEMIVVVDGNGNNKHVATRIFADMTANDLRTITRRASDALFHAEGAMKNSDRCRTALRWAESEACHCAQVSRQMLSDFNKTLQAARDGKRTRAAADAKVGRGVH